MTAGRILDWLYRLDHSERGNAIFYGSLALVGVLTVAIFVMGMVLA